MLRRLQLLSVLFAVPLVAQPPIQSDAFVDTVGINIHLDTANTLYYKNFPLIQNSLASLGIRHFRDSFVNTTDQNFYNNLNQLAPLGMKGVFTVASGQDTSTLQNWPSKVSSVFEGYEAPNEVDRFSGGVAGMQYYLPIMVNAAHTGVAPNAFIVGPSFTQTASYSQMGDASSLIDFGNLHTYTGGRNPGTPGWGGLDPQGNAYGSINYATDYEKIVAGTKPIYMTETGFDYATGYVNYVSEEVGAIYMPRLLLENYLHGIARTYLYELLTGVIQPTRDFGLLRNDGSPRPAYYAIANMMKMLADPGPTFQPDLLFYTVDGGDSTVHKLLVQKRDGTYYLFVWLETQGWDPDKHFRTPPTPEPVVLNIDNGKFFSSAVVHQWDSTGNVTDTTLPGGFSFPLTVSENIQVVQLNPPNGTFPVAATVTPAGAGVVNTSGPVLSNGLYNDGSQVSLTAVPSPGYVFTGFTGGYTSSANPSTVTVHGAPVTTSANFACTYTPSSNSTGFPTAGGTATLGYTTGATCNAAPVSSAPWLTASAVGGSLALTATNNPGAARSATVTLGNAVIAVNQVAGSGYINATTTGSLSGSFIYVDGKAQFVGNVQRWQPNSVHTLSQPAAQRVGGITYLPGPWTGAATGTGTVSVTAPFNDISFGVQFIQGFYLNALTTAGGTVSTSLPGTVFDSSTYFYPTDSVTVVATPNPGCSFVTWKGISSTSPTIVVTPNVSRTVIATFSCPKS